MTLAACPTFYDGQTSSPPWRLEMHRTLLAAGVPISLNTDDPAQFGSGWLSTTIGSAMAAAPFSRAEVLRFAEHAIESSWTDDATRRTLSAELRHFAAA